MNVLFGETRQVLFLLNRRMSARALVEHLLQLGHGVGLMSEIGPLLQVGEMLRLGSIKG
jgi:hypothetical protein